ASRLFLFRSSTAWAMVVEAFGYTRQIGIPHTAVYSFGSHLVNRPGPENFINHYMWEQHRKQHPCDELRYVYPVEDGGWQEGEFVAEGAEEVVVRNEFIPVPNDADRRAPNSGVDFSGFDASERLSVSALCDYLARGHRELVLCQPEELVVNLTSDMKLLLKLDAWHHPDVAGGGRPSDEGDFIKLAEVLSSGDATKF
ncbi:MAG: hypothetical protein ACAI34_25665, partial [Verrucomicrobium sp.]